MDEMFVNVVFENSCLVCNKKKFILWVYIVWDEIIVYWNCFYIIKCFF